MNIQQYTDKYFTHTKHILQAEHIDPWVTMQIFIRKGPGKIGGMSEAIDLIISESGIDYVNGRIWALKDGQRYEPSETIMHIEGPLQLLVELETIYLGILSHGTTIASGDSGVQTGPMQNSMRRIVKLAGDRPVYYFGTRHYHYALDEHIGCQMIDAGASGCSTDIGAKITGNEGVGTMPHALMLACDKKCRRYINDDATDITATLFDKHIDKSIKRVVLVDTWNNEISVSIESMNALQEQMGERFQDNPPGIRIDTCGENIGEGCHYGKGVTIELARNVRLALDKAGYNDVTISLTSGFANPDKVKRFVDAEKVLGMRLFDSLGVGQLWPNRSATADIVKIDGKLISKTGREYIPNKRLKRVL